MAMTTQTQYNSDNELWQLQSQLARYRPDLSDKFVLKIDTAQHVISVDEYLDHLYVERESGSFEKNLEFAMINEERMLCISGEMGSGKTSALEYVRRSLSTTHPEYYVLRLDLKQLWSNTDDLLIDARERRSDEDEIWIETVNQLLRKSIELEFFADPDRFRKLVAWTLAGLPDYSDEFDKTLILEFLDISRDACIRANCVKKCRADRVVEIENFLVSQQQYYLDVMKTLSRMLKPEHCIHCSLFSNADMKMLLIVVDNVDRIPPKHIPHFLLACRDIRMRLGPYCTITVGIRIENIRNHTLPGEDHFFHIVAPDELHYRGILLPHIHRKHMSEVLNKRAEYISDLLRKHDSMYRTGLFEQHEKSVGGLHRYVVREFVEEAINSLSNDSYLTVLDVYNGFLNYLRKLEESNLINHESFESEQYGPSLQTLFYLWLQKHGKDVGIRLFSMIPHEAPADTLTISDIASVHHLLLTCILNASREVDIGHYENHFPKWRTIVERMKCIGFDYDSIRDALSLFVSPLGQPPGAVRFVEYEISKTEIQELPENSEAMVRLSTLGEQLVKEFLHKVGYVWGVAYRSGTINIPSNVFYYKFTRVQRARHIYEFVKNTLAKKHLRFLCLVDRKMRCEGRNAWFGLYRQRFGVDRLLQVERILESSARYFSSMYVKTRTKEQIEHESANPFLVLRTEYSLLANDAANGVDYDSLNFARLSSGDLLMLNAEKDE